VEAATAEDTRGSAERAQWVAAAAGGFFGFLSGFSEDMVPFTAICAAVLPLVAIAAGIANPAGGAARILIPANGALAGFVGAFLVAFGVGLTGAVNTSECSRTVEAQLPLLLFSSMVYLAGAGLLLGLLFAQRRRIRTRKPTWYWPTLALYPVAVVACFAAVWLAAGATSC
jgi:hypothetical protein